MNKTVHMEQKFFTLNSKIYNICSVAKIFTGCIKWAFRYLHVKYLSNQMIFKFLHKLALITNILEFLQF